MENCLFCKIVRKEIPSRTVFEDDAVLAFYDVNPQAPVHILVIPKTHRGGFLEMKEKEDPSLEGYLMSVIRKIAREKGLDQKGFRLVINQGSDGGQTVFHLHYHLLGGRAMAWPPG
ncbi:MAG: histidine triad nucleotide-binding protein [Nitrospirae bacterium]|nr:histidine triad nucleotide-binding protein [Nitrospirota bacterium]MBI3605984.1 histidine triad nucleotide-binding protein [Nitrospirota bacterium]